MAKQINYEERYCAFIDILGFSALISSIGKDRTSYETIRDLLQQVYRPLKKDSNLFRGSDFRAQSISDALAMSAARNEQGLLNLFLILEQLARDLLAEGYFLRGGIVRGLLYHDNRMVFGKALIDAYHLESKVARFPRIMITRDVVRDTNNFFLPQTFGSLICRADDGPYFLHVLRRLGRDASDDWQPDELQPADQTEALEPYRLMSMRIQQRFEEATDNPSHFEKVQWFARYWNESLEGSTKVLPVTGPGLHIKPAVWGRIA